mgnify:CR=1 FL=1
MGLGACVAELPAPVLVGPSYRNPSALIGVTSRFDAEKFSGLWYVRAGFDPAIGRMAFRMIDTPKGHAMRLGVSVCDGAGVCGDYSDDLPATKKEKGRYSVQMPDGNTREFWVLWVDEGFRTAVLGNKQEILDFNGYDVSQLKVVK